MAAFNEKEGSSHTRYQYNQNQRIELKLLPLAPYSPDLASLDDFLFPNLQNSSVIKDYRYFTELYSSYYKQITDHRQKRCIDLKLCGEIKILPPKFIIFS